MKLLHTSDWHLGKSLGGHPLEEDQRFALEQVTALVEREPHDLLVVAGDVFDRAQPAPEALRLLGGWLGDLRRRVPALPVVMIAGNHDSGPRLAWAAQLLDRQHLYLRGEPDAIDDPIRVRGADGVEAEVWALPFLLPGALGEAAPSQAAAMDEALRRIAARQDRGRAQVLAAHCFVRDCEPSDSERAFVGLATQIDPAAFAGFDYVALGHLHRPQAAAANARYSGSLCRYSFAEAGHDKEVVSVEVGPGRPPRVTPHPLRSRRGMHRLTGSLERLRDDPVFADRTDDYVELTLDPPVEVGNPLEQLRARWRFLLRLRNELVAPTAALARGGDGAGDGPRDLEADFREFDAQFAAGEVTPEELLAAFHALHRRLERREDGA